MSEQAILYKTISVEGLRIFYRETGPSAAPTVLLLHGYPASSFMYRNLFPVLNRHFHVIAPDLPGFGFSDAPGHDVFEYSFDRLARVMQAFIDALGMKRFAVYIFDYGAPVGLRLCLANPEKIAGIITQNGNAYEEGLSTGWNTIQKYWQDPSQENRYALKEFLTLGATKVQYQQGASDPALIAPETYTLDQHFLDRPGNVEIQLDLLKDYQSNVRMYPRFQEYFRTSQPPLLAVWGNRDPYFLPQGAEAYKRDNPNATVKFYDTGHFALETHAAAIGQDVLGFLQKLFPVAGGVHPADVVVRASPYSVKESISRLQDFLKQQGVTIYARIDQQRELARVGLPVGALEYLLFGNPKGGGPVMQENPVAAIALPLKVIAWEDAAKKVWVAYYSGDSVAASFGISARAAAPLHIDGLIDKLF
ncbi:alpha/beta fold hydrolase [Puia sp.]|jgi:pimeloyl-ACP methyl ester carboxylesterase/uncharacterized protein (DUF302 family)|uniref:alpha/beta fold hydrolase n=1 Tax=Puia sp. TaxID=2045100 RepID=UPI002F4127C9